MKLYIKYFLFIYILAISSFEYFFRVTQTATYLLFPIVLFLFFNYNLRFDTKVITVLLTFASIFVLQTILFHSPLYYAFTLVIRLLALYFAAKIIGANFIGIFINTLKIISIIAIFFYVLEYIPPIQNMMLNFSTHFTNLGAKPDDELINKPNFIIYALQTEYDFGYIRNAGPFWEPGVFVVFLNIALFFNLFIKKKFFERTNILFIVCIITTFSTSGYIGLLANITFFALASKKISIVYRVIMILLLVGSVPAIMSLPFMKDKINENMEQSDLSYSRFGAALVHWQIIQDYPFTGLPYDTTSYDEYADNISPNGVTEIFVRYGVICGFLYYFFLFRASKSLMQFMGYRNRGYLLFFIFVLLIFSECLGNRPIYLTFLFIPYIGLNRVVQRKNIQRDANNIPVQVQTI